jgi:hypothetical protein
MAADPIPVALAAPVAPSPPPIGKPWALPPAGLAVFYGRPETPRLFHYFLPRLLAEGKRVLCLDGANRFDPLLIARLARQRGIVAAEFNRRIRVARAFTCFQLTELLVRVPWRSATRWTRCGRSLLCRWASRCFRMRRRWRLRAARCSRNLRRRRPSCGDSRSMERTASCS